jgi:hypothetical protein|tara:strand:+ start:82 stop:1341 length:1260 start_codon:yes stop_codon:yes gene_type:complete
MKKLLILILFPYFIIAQEISIEDFISDPNNFKFLSSSTKETILDLSNPIVLKFNNAILNDFKTSSYKKYTNCRRVVNKQLSDQYYFSGGVSRFEADLLATSNKCNVNKYSGIIIDSLSEVGPFNEKSLLWQDILDKYDNDYLKISEIGLTKEDLKEYSIYQVINDTLDFIEDSNDITLKFSWKSENAGADINQILQAHSIYERSTYVNGKLTLPTFTLHDIYNIGNKKSFDSKIIIKIEKKGMAFEDIDLSFEDLNTQINTETYSNAIYAIFKDFASDEIKQLSKIIEQDKKDRKKRIKQDKKDGRYLNSENQRITGQKIEDYETKYYRKLSLIDGLIDKQRFFYRDGPKKDLPINETLYSKAPDGNSKSVTHYKNGYPVKKRTMDKKGSLLTVETYNEGKLKKVEYYVDGKKFTETNF